MANLFKVPFRLLSFLMLIGAEAAPADLVLIANAKILVNKISREEAVNIYMGRFRRLPSGAVVQPLDLPPDRAEKALFYHLLVNKDMADIDAYWARLVFSGRASPPCTVSDLKTVVDNVARDPSVIGYVDRSFTDKRVKVILELQD